MSGRWERNWVEVPASEIVVGDLYANVGSVSLVVHGPGTATWNGREYVVDEGYSFFACGDSHAVTRIASTQRKVVGRDARWVKS